uniref:Scaffold attachment factor B n=1 Tax=Gasterosteus aculeatus aculeatus TaxID=481459 RepID=A0AAQ4QEP4_GASAC
MGNLWVSGLSSTTRATDLKTLFSKYGKVSLVMLSPYPAEPRGSLLWFCHHVYIR